MIPLTIFVCILFGVYFLAACFPEKVKDFIARWAFKNDN